jgi:hypothetical protein
MRPYVFDIDPANADPNGIADDLPTGTSWSFSGDAEWLAESSGDGLAHRLIITTAGNEPGGNGAILTLVGTDPDGIAQTEAITLPNATTIESTKYWLTVPSGTTQAATVGTFDIGWVDEIKTKTLPLNYRAHEAATHAVDVTGVIDYTVNETLEEIHPQLNAGTPENLSWFPITALTAKTADLKELGELHSSACQLVVNSYTDTAEIKWVVFQNED